MDSRLRAYLADAPEMVEPPDFIDWAVGWYEMWANEAEIFKRAADWPSRVENVEERKADVGPLKAVAQYYLNRHRTWGAMISKPPVWSRFKDFKDRPLSNRELLPLIAALQPRDRLLEIRERVEAALSMAVKAMEVARTKDGELNTKQNWKKVCHRLLKDLDTIDEAIERYDALRAEALGLEDDDLWVD